MSLEPTHISYITYNNARSFTGLCPASNSKLYPAHVGSMVHQDEEFFQNFSRTPLMTREWDLTRLALVDNEETFTKERSHSFLESNSVEERNNCLVAFSKTKVSLSTCRASCTSIGATSYRWFRMGCCECIGKHCFNYGSHEPHCKMLQQR